MQQAVMEREYSHEGNYWSDFNGKELYVIGENNANHYPVMRPITISTTPPPTIETFSDSTLTIAAVGIAAVIIFAVTLFI